MPTSLSDAAIADLSFAHLTRVVAIDSQSDETSTAIPTTEGQKVLAADLDTFFSGLGATVERDEFANIITTFPGRGAGADAPPLALMVHLDTARGTANPKTLNISRGWDGQSIPYPGNPRLQVSVANYPALASFVGQDIVFGDGTTPFGLDDKLGLTHLMTLATILAGDATIDHPPLLLIGRPDEEVGRMEAVVGLAEMLAKRGVRSGFTVDGILAFEVNLENFNAAEANVWLSGAPVSAPALPTGGVVEIFIGGVNTHGCTAKAEGFRAATRLAGELIDTLNDGLNADGGAPVFAVDFASDARRDCDGRLRLAVSGVGDLDRIESACTAVIGAHEPRGASYSVGRLEPGINTAMDSVHRGLAAIGGFLRSDPGFVVAAEESEGRQGYSAPYRAMVDADGRFRVDVRLRDFDPAGLQARKSHVEAVFGGEFAVALHDQYVNMGPRLADRRDLVALASAAGEAISVAVEELPIRGGTGVDPFLDQGVAIGNLGTGYFAPESEKELTSLQMMSAHARWLVALVEGAAGLRS